MCKTKLSIADNHRTWRAAGQSTHKPHRRRPDRSPFCSRSDRARRVDKKSPPSPPPQQSTMSFLLLTVMSSLVVWDAEAWSAIGRYAVSCPDRCGAERCAAQRCARTVLDDCGCCQVCAAARGEHCYRTVSGMHGVKCGPGLFCEFYKDEDDYGDEYGICKDCPYGTYGVECRKTCSCKGGICDRENGACLTLTFFAKIASKLRTEPQTGGEMGSGEVRSGQSAEQLTGRSSAPKRLNPR